MKNLIERLLLLFFYHERESKDNRVWWTVFAVLMVATVAVRFYKLHRPERVWYLIYSNNFNVKV